MTLWELITAVRERYVEGYRLTLRQHGPSLQNLMAEPLVRTDGADDVPIDYRVFRADIIWQAEDKPQVGALSPMLPITPPDLVVHYPDGQRLEVQRFSWDDCVIIATPVPSTDEPIIGWLRQWRDRPDATPDADGLVYSVHSMTPPATDGTAMLTVVDFGSAPVEAFTALIAALLSTGVREIRLTTTPRDEPPIEPPPGVVV